MLDAGSPDEMGPDRCVWSGLHRRWATATRLLPGNWGEMRERGAAPGARGGVGAGAPFGA